MNMTITKSLDELKADAEQALKAVQEAEKVQREAAQAEERARRQAAEREQRQVEANARLPYVQQLVDALQAKGVDAVVKMGDVDKSGYSAHLPSITFGESIPYGAQAEFEESRSSGWRGRTRLSVHVGSYGHKKTFPLKKDGTFNYEKIATEVATRVANTKAAEVARVEKEGAQAAADAFAKEVKKNLGSKKEYDWIDMRVKGSYGQSVGGVRHHRYYSYTAPKGHVYVEVGTVTATPENAAKLIATLREIGFIKE